MFSTDEPLHPTNAVVPTPVADMDATPTGRAAHPAPGPRAWLGTLLIIAGCTAIAALMERQFDPANLTMIYLLGVVVTAIAFGRGAAVASAVLSVATFDFIFVPPRFTFSVADTQYLVTFAVMLVVAVVIGTLTAWLREQREGALLRERRTAALHRLSRDLALGSTVTDVVTSAARRIAETVDAEVALSLGATRDDLTFVAGNPRVASGESEHAAPRRVHERVRAGAPGSGDTTGALSGARPPRRAAPGVPPVASGLHLPLESGNHFLGVLSVRPHDPRMLHDRERLHLLRALASQTGLAIERCRLAADNERVRVQADTERTRSALLSSVSHDLRTPLASITGAASSLRDDPLSDATRRELADTLAEEAMRLNRLIGNVLDMTRLESETLHLRKEWQSLEEVVGAALARLELVLGDRPVRLSLPADLPLVRLDDVLFEQVVRNLVENACKYAPPGDPIEVGAVVEGGELRLEVADRGPGIAPGDEHRLFEKFYRGPNAAGQPGVGLGLSICRAIVQAHGGTIEAVRRPGGGALFVVGLPLERPPANIVEPQPQPAGLGS